jgi:hypothetical protein
MIRQEQCNKVCRILDDVLANRPTERDSLIVATRKAFEALEAHEEQRWIPVTEESVIQAGYEGREVRFRIRGRLFAIRELAQ